MSYLFLFIVVFLGALFTSISGFGFALISTPLLCLMLPTKEAIVMMPFLSVILHFINMYRTRGKFELKFIMGILAGYFIGLVPGVCLLKIISAAKLQIFLGIFLMTVTCLMALKYSVKVKNKTLGRMTAGMIGAFVGSITSVNGPPIVLYCLNEKMEKTLMRANLIWIFGTASLVTILANFLAGNLQQITDWKRLLVLWPAVLLASFFGERCFKKIDQQLFYKMALVVVFMGGCMMLYQGISKLW